MGIWAMNANVGNIIGSSLCNVLENNGASWVWNFMLTGLFGLGVAAVMFFFLKEKPDEEVEATATALNASTENVNNNGNGK